MTDNFKNICKEPAYKNRLGTITLQDGSTITEDDYLVSMEVVDDCYLNGKIIGTSNAKTISISTLDNYSISDTHIHAQIGVKYDDESDEYLNLGEFIISEETNEQTASNGSYNGYDSLTKLDSEYVCGITDWTNVTIADVYSDLCNNVGLTPKTLEFINSDFPVVGNPFTNKEKYRDVLNDIAEIACSFVRIDNDDKSIDLVWFDDDVTETLTKDDYASLTLNQKYGEINSLAIKESQVEGENVVMNDNDSIAENGQTQYAITDNYFLNTEELRRKAITKIWERIKGFTYYDCVIETDLGRPYLRPGNKIKVEDDNGNYFETYVMKHTFKFDGAFHSTIESPALTNEETKIENNYETVKDKFRRVEIAVDKVNGQIESMLENSEEEYNQIIQTITETINSIQRVGNSNLILNSVMFAYDSNNKPNDWEVSEDGTISIQSSPESMNAGCISGHSFTLLGKTVKQKVTVKTDSDSVPNEEKVYYTFSTKIKKDETGTCYVKLYNSNEEHIIELGSGQSSFYGEYQLQALLPKDSYYYVEFYGSEDSNATFTDNILSIGEYSTQWCQASGEIMNTQVNFSVDGILVKSSVYEGDYTVMSPLEFAGYSNVNGTITKIFSLNKDVTEVRKLKAEEEIKMYPIKIVPITEGDMQGWAFVPTSKESDY